MGKIKRTRNILHLSAPKPETSNEGQKIENADFKSNSQVNLNANLFQNVTIPANLFKDVTITPQSLKQKLPAYSDKDKYNLRVKEVVSSSQREELEQKLRQKYGRKKIPFSEVVPSVLAFLKKKEKEDKKKAAAILGDYGALKSALPGLNQLMKESKDKHSGSKPRASKPFRKQEEEMMEDIQTFKGVLKDSQYASDPFAIIGAQLKQKFRSVTL